MKIGIFDIESSDLKGNFGRILCAVVKPLGAEVYHTLRADEYQEWLDGDRASDKQITHDLLSRLDEFHILVAHNGVRFDLPFLSTRAIDNGLLPLGRKMIIDPCQLARKHLRMHSNSLEALALFVGASTQKTPLRPDIWKEVIFNGSRTGMDWMVDHCVRDVQMLEEVYRNLADLIERVDSRGSAF